MVQDPSYFNAKTVFIAGADCDFARDLVTALAQAGATLILSGTDNAALLQTASIAPDKIETLILPSSPADVMSANIAMLGEIWGDESLHLLILMQSLTHQRKPGLAVKSSMLIMDALKCGLIKGQGAIVSVISAAGPQDDPITQSAHAGIAQLMRALPDQLNRTPVRANTISVARYYCADSPDTVIAPILFLGSPAAKGVNGALLPVGPQRAKQPGKPVD